MTAVNFGVNGESVQYEVALEILGQERKPFIDAVRHEKSKPEPSVAFIRYCDLGLLALGELQENLRTSDRDTIELILDPKNRVFR